MTKRDALGFACVLFAFGALSCGGANMTTYTPVSEETKFSEDSLFGAARDAADHLGYAPRVGETSAHSLDTREKSVAVSSVPRLSYKYAFHIETTKGVLSITASCVQNSATNEQAFADCGDDRPDRVVKELATLKKEILELAPRVESRNPDWGSFGKEGASAEKDPDGGAAPPKKGGGKSAPPKPKGPAKKK